MIDRFQKTRTMDFYGLLHFLLNSLHEFFDSDFGFFNPIGPVHSRCI